MGIGIFCDQLPDYSFAARVRPLFEKQNLEPRTHSGLRRSVIKGSLPERELIQDLSEATVIVVRFQGEAATDHWLASELTSFATRSVAVFIYEKNAPSEVLTDIQKLNNLHLASYLDDADCLKKIANDLATF